VEPDFHHVAARRPDEVGRDEVGIGVRIARFGKGDGVAYGVVEGEPGGAGQSGDLTAEPRLTIAELHGHPFGVDPGGVRLTGRRYPLAEVRLLAPVLPSKVVAAGRNYAGHVREMGGEQRVESSEPVLFLKPSTAVTGPGDAIRYPVKLTDRVDFEGELAVIIGRLCRSVPRERAEEVIFGYTCANDVTARDLQARDGQWTRAKGFDTFCPLGPWMETGTDPADLELTTTVNGAVRQRARTSELLWDVPDLIAHVSQVMTLLPGDVLLTGTPAGVGPLSAGDEVSVTIESIGTLTNRVVISD
jgi:2-keto-4-pentenoate hydratase/2-oxohepta-3-ene-1,7-dioic acid hydratase in catechol pathway